MTTQIRNIAVIANGGAGKSALIEALLVQAHAINKAVKGGAGASDCVMRTEPEEVEHHIAITPHVAHLDWLDNSLYLVDTPGYFNFLEATRGVLPGVDGVVFVFSALDGVKPETVRLWNMVQEAKVPALGFINKIDDPAADFMHAVEMIGSALKLKALPIAIPFRAERDAVGIYDLLKDKAWLNKKGQAERTTLPAALSGDIRTLRTQILDVIAENNDELLESYLNGQTLSDSELLGGLKHAVLKHALLPLLCGSATMNIGIEALLDAAVQLLPSPLEREAERPLIGHLPNNTETLVGRSAKEDEYFSAITLKTSIDQFSGKLSVIRVFSGSIGANQELLNATQQLSQKASHVYLLQGRELTKVNALRAGQIGALSKLEDTHTGDTLCDLRNPVAYPAVQFAEPPLTYAIEPLDSKQDEKVSAGLSKLVDEDPTLHLHRDDQTHELLLSGMGQGHIEIALERLSRKFGGKAKLKTPRVPYRETIRKSARAQGKLKKQTGGHGQFANVWLEITPLPRGSGFQFVDKIVGGVIPKQYIPSVKKGVQEAMLKGPLVGAPVVDVQVTLYDGSFHDVDSSDYAFQVAGSLGFKAAVEEASPVILEPIMLLDISVPSECTGDVLKDISSRRGHIMQLNTSELQEVEAEIPLAEVLDYGNVLSAITSGAGVFTMSIKCYREVPSHLGERLLASRSQESAQAQPA